MRTLLIVVAFVALPLAWVAKERRQSKYESRVADQLLQRDSQMVELFGLYDSLELQIQGKPQGMWRDATRQILVERIYVVSGPPSGFTDLSLLIGLTNLEVLRLSGNEITDIGPLAGLANLRSIWLDKSQVRDLSPLIGLKKLKFLKVNNAPVSKDQIDAVQNALPNCRIDHDPFPQTNANPPQDSATEP